MKDIKVKKSEWANVISDKDVRNFNGYIETEDGDRLELRFTLQLDKKKMFVRRIAYIDKNIKKIAEIEEIFIPNKNDSIQFLGIFK